MSQSPDIRVTLGRCDDMRAEVFVRRGGDRHENAAPEGSLTGPRRGRDVTLPTTTRLVPLPAVPGSTAASRAVITEPAFWTPDLPNLYRVEVARGAGAQAAGGGIDTWIGLRRLGVRGRSFWLDGRRWVPRAIVGDIAPAQAREAGVGLIVESPSEHLLATTDETGVAVVALLRGDEASPAGIERLARHPSATLAIMMELPPDEEAIAALRRRTGTMQLGLATDGTSPPLPQPHGIDFLAVTLPAEGVPHPGWTSRPSLPLVAWRRGGSEGRRDCDLLQRDLARWGRGAVAGEPHWDWAGYLVGGGDKPDRIGS